MMTDDAADLLKRVARYEQRLKDFPPGIKISKGRVSIRVRGEGTKIHDLELRREKDHWYIETPTLKLLAMKLGEAYHA